MEEIQITPDIMCEGEKNNNTHKPAAKSADQRVEEEKQKKRSKYQRDIDNNHSLSPEEDIMCLRKCPRLDYDLLNESIFLNETGDEILPPGETTNATYV